jgi:hypothetical protein
VADFSHLMREPFETESKFFADNPTVSGMATEDDKIILNPNSNLNPEQQSSVVLNEAVRLFLRKGEVPLNFSITPKQRKFFSDLQSKGIPGEQSDEAIRATIIGRIISSDPSMQDATTSQMRIAVRIRRMMGLDEDQ